jgi:hypothetical protein
MFAEAKVVASGATVTEALALTGEGYLWLDAALLALLFLARFVAA